MPKTSRRAGSWRTSLDLQPPDVNPEYSDQIQQVMSRLFGWDESAGDQREVWRELASDPNGRLRVTSGPNTATGIQVKQVAVNSINEVQVLQPNSKRQYAMFSTLSFASSLVVALRSGDIATGVVQLWPNDFALSLDGWLGPVFMALNFAGTGPATVLVYEF